MEPNPYQSPAKQPGLGTDPRKRSAWRAYGILNASLLALLMLPLLLLLLEFLFGPYVVESLNDGDPVTYRSEFYIEPPSLLFLAIYFYVPNALLRYFRRRSIAD